MSDPGERFRRANAAVAEAMGEWSDAVKGWCEAQQLADAAFVAGCERHNAVVAARETQRLARLAAVRMAEHRGGLQA